MVANYLKRLISSVFLLLFLNYIIMGSALAGTEAIIDGTNVNVRAGSSTANEVVTQVQEGERFTVLSEKDDWVQLALPDGGSGWVAGWLVKLEQTPDTAGEKRITVRVSEKAVEFDAQPYIDQNSRTMVPIRFVAEALGAQVQWVQQESKAVILDQGQKVELWIGKSTARVNDADVQMDTQAVLKDERTMIPLRFVSENLGAMVFWRQETQTADIYPKAKALRQTVAVEVDILNVRSGPGTAFEKIAQLEQETVLPVTAKSGEWYKVVLEDGSAGWIASWLVEIILDADDPVIKVAVSAGSSVNVRTGPNTSYPVIYQLEKGERFELLASAGGWSQVRLADSTEGWVSSRYVTVRDDLSPPSRSPEPGDRPKYPDGHSDEEVPDGMGGGSEPELSITKVDIRGSSTEFIIRGQYSGAPQVMTLKDPHRLVMDFHGASLGPEGSGETVEVDSYLVKTIRSGQFTPDTVRVVADLTGPVSYGWDTDSETGALRVSLSAPSLEGRTIVVDPGHGSRQPGDWYDPGAIGPSGLYESDVALDIGLNLARQLESRGAEVILTRTGNTNYSLEDRAYVANKANADLFVSVHADSSPSPLLNGTSVYYYSSGGGAQRSERIRLAQSVQDQLVRKLGRQDLGIREANFSVLRNTRSVAILVETAFISNPAEEKLLKDAGFRARAAEAIADGITEYFNR